MKILITGSDGFIAKNLIYNLTECNKYNILTYNRNQTSDQLRKLVEQCDAIIHLAGTNRPNNHEEYVRCNTNLTQEICKLVFDTNKKKKVIFTSSTQAILSNPYGLSKLRAEESLIKLSKIRPAVVSIFRLPGVFGKWCKPNYNSVVATFCFNAANNLPLLIDDNSKIIDLVYIDDVVKSIVQSLDLEQPGYRYLNVEPVYKISLNNLANYIFDFKNGTNNLLVNNVGDGFLRALYATYLSYLKPSQFHYNLLKHEDPRGCFVEILKTFNAGQFSYFTAHPGMTRGCHYHHTKNEKFLVVKGKALFKFRNILNNQQYELFVDGATPQIVQTIPGWAHSISNIGKEDIFVFLWANETFNQSLPDTISTQV